VAASSIRMTSPSPDLTRERWSRLCGAVHELERALAAPAEEPTWRITVVRRLAALREVFAEHAELIEGAEGAGLYADLVDHAPRVSPGVLRLVRQHAQLRRSINAVCLRMPGADPDQVREWVRDLLRELSRNRQRGADLVYETYETDIGGET
jgi:hypothetical protein